VIAVLVEGHSDAGFVEELCKRIGIGCRAFILRGNRVEKAVRKARALASSYRHILILKDAHWASTDALDRFEEEVGRSLRDLMEEGIEIRVLRVSKSIESWILAGLCEENPEEVVDPERRLSERVGRIVVKAEGPYRGLARVVDVDHAMVKSPSLGKFVEALRSHGVIERTDV